MVMKKIFSILLLVLSMNLYSQEYYPLTGEGKHWIVALPDEWGFGYYDELWEYYMTGDTVINNLSYKKVYYRSLVVPESMQPPFEAAEDYWLYGVIRDDEPNKKAYAINFWDNLEECNSNEEYLMYDYSLIPGETPDFCTFSDSYAYNYINQIEEGILFNVSTRTFSSSQFFEYYEGIGSMCGLYELIIILVKKSEPNPVPRLTYYCPTNDCDVLLDIDKPTAIKQFKTYPNPISTTTQTHITFELPPITTETTLHITDIFGKTIEELPLIKDQTQLVWNSSTVATGVYFYQTKIAGVVYRGKIIVN